jgi:equilibrative nucleoside transporter 1/2/3
MIPVTIEADPNIPAMDAFTGGYLSSLAMMYCPRCVEPEYASIAGMFGSASIVTGIIGGIGCSYLMPRLISWQALDFDIPEWWPAYKW